jgi:hypothetical protein
VLPGTSVPISNIVAVVASSCRRQVPALIPACPL